MIILHYSLKPENVLIDNVGYIRITDFGLSKNNLRGNTAKSVVGTPEYLAPEILDRNGHGKVKIHFNQFYKYLPDTHINTHFDNNFTTFLTTYSINMLITFKGFKIKLLNSIK